MAAAGRRRTASIAIIIIEGLLGPCKLLNAAGALGFGCRKVTALALALALPFSFAIALLALLALLARDVELEVHRLPMDLLVVQFDRLVDLLVLIEIDESE